MSNISRATLPQEFYDITSASLLLQPEPQYLHALLAKSAFDAEISAMNIGLQIPGRDFPTSGAAYADIDAARLNLSDTILSPAIKVQNEFGGEMVGPTGSTGLRRLRLPLHGPCEPQADQRRPDRTGAS
jgi:hypothetical protein